LNAIEGEDAERAAKDMLLARDDVDGGGDEIFAGLTASKSFIDDEEANSFEGDLPSSPLPPPLSSPSTPPPPPRPPTSLATVSTSKQKKNSIARQHANSRNRRKRETPPSLHQDDSAAAQRMVSLTFTFYYFCVDGARWFLSLSF